MVLKTLLLLALLLLMYLRWYRKQGQSMAFTWIGIAFVYRYALGIAYGYIFLRFYGGDDTWVFNNDALVEYQKLLHSPGQFIADLSPIRIFHSGTPFTQRISSYLADLEYWMITKPLALVQWYTNGNYYLNVLFFNGISFWGSLLMYRFLIVSNRARPLIFFWIFFFPPLVFWWSGIRSDGLILLFTALLLSGFRGVTEKKTSGQVMVLLTGIAGILILRPPLLLLWIPAILCWYIRVRYTKKTALTLLFVYGTATLVFFGSAWADPEHNLPAQVVSRQYAFFSLAGKTRFALDSLSTDPIRFIQVAPQAVKNTFFRPWLWEAKGALQWMSALDILVLWAMLLYFLVNRRQWNREELLSPQLLYPALFGLTLYLFIGYTIPFPGAIVRYKVSAELFLLAFLSVRRKK